MLMPLCPPPFPPSTASAAGPKGAAEHQAAGAHQGERPGGEQAGGGQGAEAHGAAGCGCQAGEVWAGVGRVWGGAGVTPGKQWG